MKLSKKLLALGLSVGLVVSAVVPAFAAEIDPINVMKTKVYDAIKKNTYTAAEKADAMAYAEDVVDRWDDSIYTNNTLWVYANGVKVYVHLDSADHGFSLEDIKNPQKADKKIVQMNLTQWLTYHKEEADQYYAEMKSDFNTLAHKLKFDSTVTRDGYDMIFKLYKNNTNVTDDNDYITSWRLTTLLANWTNEGSSLSDLRNALAYAKTGTDDKKTDDKKADDKKDTTNCTTCNTTTTTTTTTTTGAANAAKGSGLPLANTATNYGNVMALGLGAMVVALGVFAYSKKITA